MHKPINGIPKRAALFPSPHSGAHSSDSRNIAQMAPLVLRDAFRASRFAELIEYRTQTLDDLTLAVREAIDAGISDAIILGGDGSLHQVMSRLVTACERQRRPMPRIAVLPAGTMNVVASALGLHGADRMHALDELARRYRSGEPQPEVRAHVLRINDRYGFLYGAGLPVNGLMRYNAYERRGMLRAAHVFAKIMAEEIGASAGIPRREPSVAEPFGARIAHATEDGADITSGDGWTAILAGTIESIGLGSRPLYRARETPGRFHLVAGAHGFWEYATKLHAVVRGAGLGGTLDHTVTHAAIHYDRPMHRFIDGDMYDAGREPTSDVLGCGPLITFLKA